MIPIMNERVEAERILETGKIGDNPYETLSLLARYYWCNITTKQKNKEICRLLSDFFEKKLPNYRSDEWEEPIAKCIKRAKKYPIVEINEIPVTENELKTIKEIPSKKLRKLAFTILVLSKFGNMRNPNNNNWCTIDDTTLFKLARVAGHTREQCLCVYELMKMDLITYSKKIDNLNIRTEFIDNDSKVVMKVTDLRELGWQYLATEGEKFIKCKKCGVLIKSTANSKKYCSDCGGYEPIKVKTLKCCDCGEEFTVMSNSRNKTRCDDCQFKYRKSIINNNAKRYYLKTKR